MKSDGMKIAVSILATALISLGGAYGAFGRDVVTRGELAQQMQNFSPYEKDRAALMTRLDTIQADVSEVRSEMRYQAAYAASMNTRLALLVKDVDMIQKLVRAHINHSK